MSTPKTPIVKNRFSPSERVRSPIGKQPAKQEFKDDADINSIMRKFQKTGTMDHAKIYAAEYGFASPTDYHQSMNIITKAGNMFQQLPSSVRNRFSNNPADFLEFVQNEANREEAVKLGLVIAGDTPPGAETAPEPPGAANPGASGGVGGQETPTPPTPPVATQEPSAS